MFPIEILLIVPEKENITAAEKRAVMSVIKNAFFITGLKSREREIQSAQSLVTATLTPV